MANITSLCKDESTYNKQNKQLIVPVFGILSTVLHSLEFPWQTLEKLKGVVPSVVGINPLRELHCW